MNWLKTINPLSLVRSAGERERQASCLHDACCLLAAAAAAAILRGFIRPPNSGGEEGGRGTVKHDAVCWAAAATAESKGGRLTH